MREPLPRKNDSKDAEVGGVVQYMRTNMIRLGHASVERLTILVNQWRPVIGWRGHSTASAKHSLFRTLLPALAPQPDNPHLLSHVSIPLLEVSAPLLKQHVGQESAVQEVPSGHQLRQDAPRTVWLLLIRSIFPARKQVATFSHAIALKPSQRLP
jgi:hypothetical protein